MHHNNDINYTTWKIHQYNSYLNCYKKNYKLQIKNVKGENFYETIFMYRYLDYKTMEQIAEIMNYNERTIRRKHHSGIEKLSGNVLECPP